jgi:peroxidase
MSIFLKGIISEQFKRLKFGDRYWYENAFGTSEYYFSPEQLKEIKNANIGRLLCDHVGLDFVQHYPFWKQNSYANPLVSCDKFKKVDLSKFSLGCKKKPGFYEYNTI